MTICEICDKDPTSHSFSKLCERKGVCMYYTKPSAATKYKDKAGIKNHVRNLLEQNKTKPWKWTIDGEGFEMKHAMEVGTTKSLLKMISNNYDENLIEIRVINMNSVIKGFYKVISPFLSSSVHSKIVFE